jgi:hypothetical protein
MTNNVDRPNSGELFGLVASRETVQTRWNTISTMLTRMMAR